MSSRNKRRMTSKLSLTAVVERAYHTDQRVPYQVVRADTAMWATSVQKGGKYENPRGRYLRRPQAKQQ